MRTISISKKIAIAILASVNQTLTLEKTAFLVSHDCTLTAKRKGCVWQYTLTGTSEEAVNEVLATQGHKLTDNKPVPLASAELASLVMMCFFESFGALLEM